MTLPDSIVAAKCKIYSDSPFFSVLVSNTPIVETQVIPTAATNGTSIMYNPQWIDTLTRKEVIGVLLHEVLHLALNHVYRGNKFPNPKKANIAADYIVNQIVLEVFKDKSYLPSYGMFDAKLAMLSLEEIYDTIPDPPESKQVNVCLRSDLSEDGEDPSSDQIAATQKEWESLLEQAAMAQEMSDSKEPGTGSKLLDMILDRYRDPTIPWDQLLEIYFQKSIDSYIDWEMPDRRWLGTHPNVYMDTLSGRKVKAHVYLDTSGSISDDLLEQFLNEVKDLSERMGVELHAYDFDVNLYVHDLHENKVKGRGGTDFDCIVNHLVLDGTSVPLEDDLSTNISEVNVAIVLTDGWASFNKEKREQVNVPLLWILDSTSNMERFSREYPKEVTSFMGGRT